MEAKTITPQPRAQGTVVLLPPPGFLGHFIPFIELANQLVLHHNCTVTLIIPHDGTSMNPQRSLLRGIPTMINTVFLPPVSTHDLPPDTTNYPEILLPTRLIRSLPSLRTALSSLETPASAMVVDLFNPHAIQVARELSIPAYIFYVIAATDLALDMDLPKLEAYGTTPEWIDLCKMYRLADGVLVNSFLELEPEAFHVLQEMIGIPRVYPVGPLIRTGLETESDCLKWLDDQPLRSVLYVSFGSGGTLSMEQLRELAYGLEMSGQRFLWVVRKPQENVAAAYLSTTDQEDDPLSFLPEGFLGRTKDKGLVVASWAPQIQVLSHDSTGGFVTHCGWNSILESVVFGVPLIAWPLCFEQKMHGDFLTDVLKCAIRVKENEIGIVERGCISEMVKQLMEGEEGKSIRNSMIHLKISAGNVLSQEGSSTQALAQVVNNWIHGDL